MGALYFHFTPHEIWYLRVVLPVLIWRVLKRREKDVREAYKSNVCQLYDLIIVEGHPRQNRVEREAADDTKNKA